MSFRLEIPKLISVRGGSCDLVWDNNGTLMETVGTVIVIPCLILFSIFALSIWFLRPRGVFFFFSFLFLLSRTLPYSPPPSLLSFFDVTANSANSRGAFSQLIFIALRPTPVHKIPGSSFACLIRRDLPQPRHLHCIASPRSN